MALVKPQFEAGREEVGKGGLVRDPAIHARVLDEVTAAAAEVGLTRVGLVDSPITGAEGNIEFLMHLRHRRSRRGEESMRWIVAKPSLTAARETLAGLERWLHEHHVDAVWTREAADADAGWPAPGLVTRGVARARGPAARARRRRHAAGDGRHHRAVGARRADPRRQLRVARLSHRNHAARSCTRRSRRPSPDVPSSTSG